MGFIPVWDLPQYGVYPSMGRMKENKPGRIIKIAKIRIDVLFQ
jgi:hypothetical protein